jgi:uncharacterized protein (UPF0335 family)
MNLRKDLLNKNSQALILYLVMMNQKNTNNLNNIILDLSSRDNTDSNSNTDYTSAIKAILDAKNKAIIDINNAINIVISQTTEIKQIAEEAKEIAIDSKQIAEEANEISIESKQISLEAKEIAIEASQKSQEAKQLADIISSNQSSQYSILLEKINQVYSLATDAKQLATDAKQLATDAKQLATDAKQLTDILFSNQDSQYADLLLRIDYLFNQFYRSTSTNIFQIYGNISY